MYYNSAYNYDSNANQNDGSCIAVVFGCTDSTSLNYNNIANTDNGSCIEIIYGCTSPSAINYDPLANQTDFSYCTNNWMYQFWCVKFQSWSKLW